MKLSVEFLLVLIGIGLVCVGADELNDETSRSDEGKEIFRNLVRPFRMEKLNLLWVKAQQVNKHKVHRLSNRWLFLILLTFVVSVWLFATIYNTSTKKNYF